MTTATRLEAHDSAAAGPPAPEVPRTVQQLRARVSKNAGGPVPPQHGSAAAPTEAAPTTVRVVGAHPGAGATTVAVAVADALAGAAPSVAVALIDPHPAETSGLVCAADRELGVTDEGWLLGHRGPIALYRRPAETTTTVGALQELPCPSPATDAERVTVVDHGTAEVIDQPLGQGRPSIHRPTGSVLVCRASVPGVRRAELVLHRHGEAGRHDLVVVLVGERRVPARGEGCHGAAAARPARRGPHGAHACPPSAHHRRHRRPAAPVLGRCGRGWRSCAWPVPISSTSPRPPRLDRVDGG